MSSVRFATIATCVLLAATSVQAGEPKVGDQVVVQVEVAATPADQLQRSDELLAQTREIPEGPRRMESALAVMASLDVIRQRWPEATEAISQAALSQADVALEFAMPRNAVDALAAVPESTDALGVELRYSRAYEALQDERALERHLLAAEKIIGKGLGHRSDADAALQMLASLDLQRGKSRDAAKRLRAAAELPGQPAVRAATLSLSALKAALRQKDAGSRADAKSAAEAVDKHLRRGRAERQPSAVSEALAVVERDLARLKAENGF